jgi:alpha-beta hydrolase superfamily lysophospholipase
VVFFAVALTAAGPAYSQTIREDSVTLDGKTYNCVYRWINKASRPKAVLIAVHGVTLHGLTFDAFARHLVDRNFVVLAPDLRGYGRRQTANQLAQPSRQFLGVAYDKSRDDVVDLVRATKSAYPDIPLYCLGESLGADIALYAASQAPTLVDGVILSSPAIEGRFNFVPQLIADSAKFIANPNRQVNLVPYIKKFASDDLRVGEDTAKDPLVRKTLSSWDLIRSLQSMRPILRYADKVNENMPVLVIQGSQDKVLRSKAIIRLIAHLRSEDQTVKWFKDRGHLMLETTYLKREVLQAVDGWLDQHREKVRPFVQASQSSFSDDFSKISFYQSESD